MEELSNYVESLDNIPEAVRPFYSEVEEGGGYKIRVKNMVEKAKLDEFRETNNRLINENKELLSKYSIVDLDEYKTLKEWKNSEKSKGKQTPDEVEKILEARTKEMKDNFLGQINDYKGKYETVEREYHNMIFTNAVTEAALKAGVRTEAIEDVANRVRGKFQVKEGKLVALTEDGQVITAKDGSGPKSVLEFISDMKASAPHFFPTSNGGAAPGNTKPNGTVKQNLSNFDKVRTGLVG